MIVCFKRLFVVIMLQAMLVSMSSGAAQAGDFAIQMCLQSAQAAYNACKVTIRNPNNCKVERGTIIQTACSKVAIHADGPRHDGCRRAGDLCTCRNTGWKGTCSGGRHKNGIYCRCSP